MRLRQYSLIVSTMIADGLFVADGLGQAAKTMFRSLWILTAVVIEATVLGGCAGLLLGSVVGGLIVASITVATACAGLAIGRHYHEHPVAYGFGNVATAAGILMFLMVAAMYLEALSGSESLIWWFAGHLPVIQTCALAALISTPIWARYASRHLQ